MKKWKSGEGSAMVLIDHPEYGHAAVIDQGGRSELARDFA